MGHFHSSSTRGLRNILSSSCSRTIRGSWVGRLPYCEWRSIEFGDILRAWRRRLFQASHARSGWPTPRFRHANTAKRQITIYEPRVHRKSSLFSATRDLLPAWPCPSHSKSSVVARHCHLGALRRPGQCATARRDPLRPRPKIVPNQPFNHNRSSRPASDCFPPRLLGCTR
jgi:hypothetical protein